MAHMRIGEGQTVLVTGASGGIGLELARCFASDGYDVVLAARSAEKLGALARELADRYKVRVDPMVSDLGQVGAGTELVKTLDVRGIVVDVLVNNAGYGIAGAFSESDVADQLGMVDLDIRAVVELTGLLWPRILKSGRGGVLNVASTAAFQPGPFMAVYSAAKAFVLSLSEALWEEARGSALRVTCLCPGPTATNFSTRAGAEKTRLFRSGGVMTAQQVARTGYRAWRAKRRLKVTGFSNALMIFGVRLSPRSVVLRIARRTMTSPSAR